jgi:hypothetical protein
MQIGVDLNSESIRILDHAVIQATPDTFHPIGGDDAGLLHPARIIIIQNLTNADLAISDVESPAYPDAWKYVVAARQALVLDCSANKTTNGGSFCYSKGTRFSAANIPTVIAPSTGAIYLTAIYAME